MFQGISARHDSRLSVFLKNWEKKAVSTKPISHKLATAAVKKLYKSHGQESPEILFVNSPLEAIRAMFDLQKTWIIDEGNIVRWIQTFNQQLRAEILSHLSQSEANVVIEEVLSQFEMENIVIFSKSLDIMDEYYHQLGNPLKPKILLWFKYQLYMPMYEHIAKIYRDSPEGIAKEIKESINEKLEGQVINQITAELTEQISRKIEAAVLQQISAKFANSLHGLGEDLSKKCWQAIMDKLKGSFWGKTRQFIESICIQPEQLGAYAGVVDYWISYRKLSVNLKIWDIFQSLVDNCGWIIPLQNVAFVCERPLKVLCDRQNRLHTIGSPAILFKDGFEVYAYQGIKLPKKYGQLQPEKWQASWLLEENNAEVRRLIIQEIGYENVLQALAWQELAWQKLDSWGEYTLLKIKKDIDIEPIHLLKMTCPSTRHIHVLRVPPSIFSAKEAITWVNWGITPDEFAVQT